MLNRVGLAFVGCALALHNWGCMPNAEGHWDPPSSSELDLQTVTYACVPLRAEFTVDGTTYVRGLFIEPSCPTRVDQTTDCYVPPTNHDPCLFSCPQLTEWKMLNGTAPMHSFTFPIADDGTNSGPMTATVHLRLSTLDDTLIWDGDQSEELPPLSDHRAGYFHKGLMQMRLDTFVWQVLGNCF